MDDVHVGILFWASLRLFCASGPRVVKTSADERKRLIRLTDKGKVLVEQMQPVWKVMAAAVTELTDTTNNLMQAIDEKQ